VPVAADFVEEAASGLAAGLESASADALPDPPSLASDGAGLFGERVAARSFLAQPDPLKRIAGVLKPLRSVPSAPQLGQNRGVGSWIPWMTSVRWPQLEQR
jgi:hypothetical protein